MAEEPIKPNPSPEQFAALQEEIQKLKENNAKLLDQNIKAKEKGKAIPPDVDVNELIAYKQKKELTTRQKNALKRHKSTHGHTKAHMDEMKKAMLAGKTFTEAHRLAMRKKGK